MPIIDLNTAVDDLVRGDIVAIPTETVYGLAARIDHPAAIARVFEVKRRPFFDPLIVHVIDAGSARALTPAWSHAHDALARAFWPGPLTLVVPKHAFVSELITSGLDTVGVRCPRHALTLELLRRVKVPLAAPSANLFGRTSPTTAAHVVTEFGDQVPVLDGGACEVGVESTVCLVTDAEVLILRPGGVSSVVIADALRAAGLARPVTRRHSVRSPGHLEAHYRPTNPVVAVTGDLDPGSLAARARAMAGTDQVRWLDWNPDPRLAARALYADLRRLSATPAVILWRPDELRARPEWEAILDRIQRATVATWT